MESLIEFCKTEMEASIALSIIGSSLSAGSIVMVYIMFSLQRWTEKVNTLLEQSVNLSSSSAPDSVDRKLMIQRINEIKGRYPIVSVLLFAAIILTLFLSIALRVSITILVIQVIVLSIVSTFILTRPTVE